MKPRYNLTNLGPNIWVICITGGPCAGKSTGMEDLRKGLSERGYLVLVLPEVPTKLMDGGVMPHIIGHEVFQDLILTDTVQQEEILFRAAVAMRDKGHKVVILCDRGIIDSSAYCSAELFGSILSRLGLSMSDVCDNRYHAVMHLRTVAFGKEELYTRDNNKARIETAEEARAADQRTLEAWQRHLHVRVIDNSTDLDGKKRRLFAEICAVIGDPVPVEREHKFLLKGFDPAIEGIRTHESIITQDYLLSEDSAKERRVRKRSDLDGASESYAYAEKTDMPDEKGARTEVSRMLTSQEYLALLAERNGSMQTVVKKRTCFFWKEQFYEVDEFMSPGLESLVLMEVERLTLEIALSLPPFVEVVKEVTGDKKFSNFQLALMGIA